jgi:hypothetical protein
MIVMQGNKFVVMDANTKEVISEHEFTDDYSMKKAKEAAMGSNNQWKGSVSP